MKIYDALYVVVVISWSYFWEISNEKKNKQGDDGSLIDLYIKEYEM